MSEAEGEARWEAAVEGRLVLTDSGRGWVPKDCCCCCGGGTEKGGMVEEDEDADEGGGGADEP